MSMVASDPAIHEVALGTEREENLDRNCPLTRSPGIGASHRRAHHEHVRSRPSLPDMLQNSRSALCSTFSLQVL